MLVGSSIWAFVIGSGCGIIATLNPERIEYRQTMDQVNYFARKRKLPAQLTIRLRSFFHSTQSTFHSKRFDGLLDMMSGSLRADVCSHVAHATLSKVSYFRKGNVEPDFLASVALALKPRVYCPRDLVSTDELVIVERGVCVRTGKVLVAGMCLGEDMIVARATFRDSAPAISLSFLHVAALARHALDEILESFPRARLTVRKAAVRIATRRAFVMAAQLIVQQEERKRALRDGTARDGDSQRSALSPPVSSVRNGVLMAVAPMQKVMAQREEEREEAWMKARSHSNSGYAQRLRESSSIKADERVLIIERKAEEIARSQANLEAKVDGLAATLTAELRSIFAAKATGASGGGGSVAASPDGGKGNGKGIAPTPVGAVRRKVNNLARASPCRGIAAASGSGSASGSAGGGTGGGAGGGTGGSKSIAPSVRRARLNPTTSAVAGTAPVVEAAAVVEGQPVSGASPGTRMLEA